MTVAKLNKHLLKRLKKQVSALRRKERVTRSKLRTALSKVKKIARAYQSKLEKRDKAVRAKVAAVESGIYLRLAKSIEKRAKKPKRVKTKKSVGKGIRVRRKAAKKSY